MPVLQAFNVSHQFDNGDTLFQSISCSMTKRRVGLVGRNGIGKSLLTSILAGEIQPASGVVTAPSSFMMYRQQPSDLLSGQQSIAQFLGKDAVLHALKQIEQGDVSEHWFELIGEQWDIESSSLRWDYRKTLISLVLGSAVVSRHVCSYGSCLKTKRSF